MFIYEYHLNKLLSLDQNYVSHIQKVTILCFRVRMKGPYFWRWNVQIHQALTWEDELLNTEYE